MRHVDALGPIFVHCRRLIEIGRRRAVVPLALFLGTFAWSFAYVSLSFYIQRLSGGDTVTTLRWTGWILGVTPPAALYVVLALLSLLCVPCAGGLGRRALA